MDNERKRAVELEVSRKNAAAVLETLERQDHKIEQLVITLNSMNSAISSLLMTHEPEFLRFGHGLFMAFATIVIAWQGIRMMFAHDGPGEQLFDFAKLLLFVSFGYAFISFYETPIPGIGISFSNLITDQTHYFASVLEARAFDNIYRHFDALSDHFMQPDAWSILANLIYWTVMLLVALAKALSLAVIVSTSPPRSRTRW